MTGETSQTYEDFVAKTTQRSSIRLEDDRENLQADTHGDMQDTRAGMNSSSSVSTENPIIKAVA